MLGTGVYVLTFRVLHVMGAIAWGGSVFLLVLFLQPAAAALGPAGAPFMRELLGKRRLTNRILAIATVTIVAGAFLYWHDWEVVGDLGDWLGNSMGQWLTFGAISALLAFGVGLFGTRPTVDRLLAVGGQIAQAGDAPPQNLVREQQRLQVQARRLARTNLVLVAIAAFAMSTARFW